MFRDADEELQRLEEELLAQEEEDEEEYDEEDEEEYEDDEDEEYDEEYEDDEPEDEVAYAPVKGYRVYNSDRCDVNLEKFSQQVESGRKMGCLAWLFVILTAAVLVLLYLYLKQGGYV